MSLFHKKNNLTLVMNVIKYLYILALLSLLIGCQGSIASQVIANSYPTEPRNYKTAGFDSSGQIGAYTKHYQYLAFKISREDWEAFYKRFPEYWRDIQKSKSYTFMNDYNTGYTAYAFRWNMMNKKKEWDGITIERLKSKFIVRGDDIYKIVFALGIPDRLLWDNDFDILIYNDDTAIIIENDKCEYSANCHDCTKYLSTEEKNKKLINTTDDVFAISDNEMLKILKQTRPEY